MPARAIAVSSDTPHTPKTPAANRLRNGTPHWNSRSCHERGSAVTKPWRYGYFISTVTTSIVLSVSLTSRCVSPGAIGSNQIAFPVS